MTVRGDPELQERLKTFLPLLYTQADLEMLPDPVKMSQEEKDKFDFEEAYAGMLKIAKWVIHSAIQNRDK